MKKTIRILLIGDVVGAPGRAMIQKHLQGLREKYAIDGVIVNGENSSLHGRGITPRIAKFFKHNHVDVVTTGNHVWFHKEIYNYLEQDRQLLRPANFPSGAPGVGVTTFRCNDVTVGVVNLQGRVFMREHTDCPFRAAESILTYLKRQTNIIFIDFHAEATSEKIGLAFYLDGKISGLVGTHTHVQTADARILPQGTAFITDLGMVGARDSMLGMKKEPIIQHLMSQMPIRFVVETASPYILCGVWIEVDRATGKAVTIESIKVTDHDLVIQEADHDDDK